MSHNKSKLNQTPETGQDQPEFSICPAGEKFPLPQAPDKIVELAGKSLAVLNCFGIFDDATIRRYFEFGCEVKGLGRGHVKRIKDEVNSQKSS